MDGNHSTNYISTHVCSRARNAPRISLFLDGTTRLVALVEILMAVDKRVQATKATCKQQCKTKLPLEKRLTSNSGPFFFSTIQSYFPL